MQKNRAKEEGKEKLCLGNIFKKKMVQRRDARIVTVNLKLGMQILLVYYAIWRICIQTLIYVLEKKLNRYKICRVYKMTRERLLNQKIWQKELLEW